MIENKTFERTVKGHVDKGADVSTAIGRAIEEDPEAYGRYLKRQIAASGPTIATRKDH